MDVVIQHCNNLQRAEISLIPGRLNIKYGPNGTGKSTIAKAIELTCREAPDLSPLTPFKHRANAELAAKFAPSVSGIVGVKSVAVFNEGYVNQFVFQQDEILKNSFEIFIRNPDFEAKMEEIEKLVADIRDTFKDSEEIEQVLNHLDELSGSFGKSQSGYSKSGRIAKGLGAGNKIDHVPPKLLGYSTFIKSENNVSWIKWQIQGNEYLKLSSDCPYCTSPTADKQETILAVSQEYDAKAIEHLVALKTILGRLSGYFAEATLAAISKIVLTETGLKKEEINYLIEVKAQVDTLREKIQDAKSASFFSLRDAEKVQIRFEQMKIDLAMLPHLHSEASKLIVDKINNCLDSVLKKAGALQGEVNKQKKGIEATIARYKAEINGFLKYAGYRYSVDIQQDGASYRMKLKHDDFDGFVERGQDHLSYGERNAFSLVLFMYECLRKNPDLVVLDDPISSFDKNKKFAILQMLFRGKDSLQGKTVLMLTHDVEPLIDLVKSLAHTFNPVPVASFLKGRKGVVSETQITKADIQSFAQICATNVKAPGEDVVKLIYLRRHHEVIDSKGAAYDLLSNLLHKRAVPLVFLEGGGTLEMAPEEVARGTAEIRQLLPTFDYATLLGNLEDEDAMRALYAKSVNGYEKLQLFRIIEGTPTNNDVLRKFINETFHIENEYMMQLNPKYFDHIPDYITDECDRILQVP